MRLAIGGCVLALMGLIGIFGTVPAADADADGWVDLFPGKDLQGWKRVPIPPDEKLADRNPWKVDAESKTLFCEGDGIKEMLLFEKQQTDGAFHVEWRFPKMDDKKDYNSGIYFRTALDGKKWYQSQVAYLDKPPQVADIFYDVPADPKPERKIIQGKGHELAKPVGEWNVHEIACKGKSITVRVNGKVATTWDACPTAKGHVGLQAEFYTIEFRNLKFKSSK